MRSKVLPLILPPKSYAELERRARAEERDPLQQARYLLRQALEGGVAGALPPDDQVIEAGSPAAAVAGYCEPS
jgi:hypothetical protein